MSGVEKRRSNFSLPVAVGQVFTWPPQSGLTWFCFLLPGRPGGFRPEPPTDPDLKLSPHPARGARGAGGAGADVWMLIYENRDDRMSHGTVVTFVCFVYLGFEVWIGDPADIRTKRVRKQKTDRQDAQLLLRLMLENRFPRIWVPDAENRDMRQLLWHRHRLVQMRTRVMNQLHVVPLNEGLRRKKALWRPAGRKQLESIALAP